MGMYLTIREPSGLMRQVSIDGGVTTVGRSPDNLVVVKDPRVSRTHLRIESNDSGVSFMGLSDGNPVLLNGEARTTGRLRPGDTLRIGDTRVIIEEGELPEPAPEAEPPDPMEALRDTVTASVEQAKLDLLEEVVRFLPRNFAREDFLLGVLEALFRIMDLGRACVALRDSPTGPTQVVVEKNREPTGGPIRLSRTIVQRVVKGGSGLLASNAMADPEFALAESVVDLGIRSVVCAPIHRGEEVIGILYGDNRLRMRSFEDEDLRFMSLIARIVSVQLENLELAGSLEVENLRLRRILGGEEELIVASPAMRRLVRMAEKAAVTDANVLITGETGTGKSLLAKTIHNLSRRSSDPYVEFSCAAIPETLLEAEVFGYGPKSGISGADPEGREGFFELAGEGTILLDEIGDLSLPLQAKILHAIDERRFRRLGSNEVKEVRCRILAATNCDLEQAIRRGEFRGDLFYRLSVVPLHVPPLKERPEAIIPLCEHFLRRMAPHRKIRIGPEVRNLLLSHSWPGNIRELNNVLARALALGDGGSLSPESLRQSLEKGHTGYSGPIPTMDEIQHRHILRVLGLFAGNKSRAAEALGISRSTLYGWLDRKSNT